MDAHEHAALGHIEAAADAAGWQLEERRPNSHHWLFTFCRPDMPAATRLHYREGFSYKLLQSISAPEVLGQYMEAKFKGVARVHGLP